MIVPAFNEEERIADSLTQISAYLTGQVYCWEVIVVDDGSTDSTADLVRDAASRTQGIRLISRAHRGKGHAVRVGMQAASGEYRFQCDADLSMPIDQLSRFLPPEFEGPGIAIGSRSAPGARRLGDPPLRKLMGKAFNLLLRLGGTGFTDTQCGYKCFAGARAQALFEQQRLDGFGSDVEVLNLARRFGIPVMEVPIVWHYRSGSKVRPVQDTFRMLADLVAIRLNALRGRYSPPHSEC